MFWTDDSGGGPYRLLSYSLMNFSSVTTYLVNLDAVLYHFLSTYDTGNIKLSQADKLIALFEPNRNTSYECCSTTPSIETKHQALLYSGQYLQSPITIL